MLLASKINRIPNLTQLSQNTNFGNMKFIILSLALATVAYAQQQPIAIVRQAADVGPDSYNYNYETANGISAEEKGQLSGPANEKGEPSIEAQGGFQYTSDDGTPIVLSYTADANGFHPQGAHLPAAPEIPAQIARALEWIKAHPSPEAQQQQQYNRQF